MGQTQLSSVSWVLSQKVCEKRKGKKILLIFKSLIFFLHWPTDRGGKKAYQISSKQDHHSQNQNFNSFFNVYRHFGIMRLLNFVQDKGVCICLPGRLKKMASETLYEIVLAKIRLEGFVVCDGKNKQYIVRFKYGHVGCCAISWLSLRYTTHGWWRDHHHLYNSHTTTTICWSWKWHGTFLISSMYCTLESILYALKSLHSSVPRVELSPSESKKV